MIGTKTHTLLWIKCHYGWWLVIVLVMIDMDGGEE